MRLSGKVKLISKDRANDPIYCDLYDRPIDVNVINESCSVNDEVLRWANIVEKQIIDDAGDKICHGKKYGDVIRKTIHIKGLPYELEVEYAFYMFDDYTDYRSKSINYDSWVDTDEWRDNKFTMAIRSPVIGDKLSAFYFADAVVHEIEHIFAVLTIKKDFRETKYDKALYNRACAYIGGPHTKPANKDISWAYYLSRWYEMHAFTHGLYGSFSGLRKSDFDIEGIYDRFKDTQQYGHLMKIKRFIENYDDYYDDLMNFFTVKNIFEDKEKINEIVKYKFKPYLKNCYKKCLNSCRKVLGTIWQEKLSNFTQYNDFETFGKKFHYGE